MGDENGSNEAPIQGSNIMDVIRELIRAFRDVFNDWRALATALFIGLIIALGFSAEALGDVSVRMIEAWRGTGCP